MKKPLCSSEHRGRNHSRYHLSFTARQGSLRIQSYPSRCNGRTRRSYFPQAGLGLPLRRVIRKDHLTASHRPAALCTGKHLPTGSPSSHRHDSTDFFQRQEGIQGKNIPFTDSSFIVRVGVDKQPGRGIMALFRRNEDAGGAGARLRGRKSDPWNLM